jgi:hypothetical protein
MIENVHQVLLQTRFDVFCVRWILNKNLSNILLGVKMQANNNRYSISAHAAMQLTKIIIRICG